jgi:hypothetical protein
MNDEPIDVKLYELSDSLMNEFREAVRLAQKQAHDAGVEYMFVLNGIRYHSFPNGDIKQHNVRAEG